MENAHILRKKMREGAAFGACITFSDATVTEALSGVLDFVWIDAEHGPFSLEVIQAHVMATKGTQAAALVRVAWNDPVLIKPVLDLGADGIIAPMVRSAEEARSLVSACRYPPDGIRGFGPRRPSKYGKEMNAEFCRSANEAVIPIAQIEHIDAINNIEQILAVPGLGAVLMGPFDLSGSMGYMAQPNHPEVIRATDRVVEQAKKAGVFAGMGVTDDPEAVRRWVAKGVSMLCIPPDFMLVKRSAQQYADAIRSALRAAGA
jgi:2-dehydro-3-deoxyglucarate aldolase/4-hydroxy-2-oxoheptanedioate aldolase